MDLLSRNIQHKVLGC